MQEKLEENEFNKRRVFSDEATFPMNGKVNRHNVCIWGKENLHATIEHERDSPKVNVFCAILKNHVRGPFFFEGNVTGNVCLQMLQNWLIDELIANEHEDFFYQQDGVLHLTRSSLCGLISITICLGDGSGVLVVKTM